MTNPPDLNSIPVLEDGAPAPEESAGYFIVNLCGLPGPAIPEPQPAEFEGLRPFVSRRLKEGNQRFYLHVGFFQSLEEADAWLATVRAAYPNAFVSELADTPRSSETAPPLADTGVLNVLEARGPSLGGESESTGSYAVQSESRVIGAQPAAPTVAWPIPAPKPQAPQVKPPVKAEAPPKPPTPTEAWNAFLAEVKSNSTSASGVRHLRVEIQRPRNRPTKSSKTRK